MMTKSELRKTYLEKRISLSSNEMDEKSHRIADRFFDVFDLGAVKILHCFITILKYNEIDTSLMYKKVWKDFPSVHMIAPRVNYESGEMDNLVFTAETQLVENKWGIREPAEGELVNIVDIDMVLVPLLCFDKRGYRVGYGKGFYDRFLSKCRPDCVKIGMSFFPTVEEIADLGHDIRLDYCVTPEDVFATENADQK